MPETSLTKHRVRTKEHWSSKLPDLPLLENWLLENKKITADQIAECAEIAREEAQNIAKVMIDKGYVFERSILNFYSEQLGIDYHDTFVKKTLEDLDFSQGFFNRFNIAVLDNMGIIPIKYETTDTSGVVQIYHVHIVLSDPWQLRDITNTVTDVIRAINLENLGKNTGGIGGQFNTTSAEYEVFNEDPQVEIYAELAKSNDIKQVLQEIGSNVEVAVYADKEEAEALRQWNDIINRAIKSKASDVHVSPISSKGGLWVRYRIDGEMEDIIKSTKSDLKLL